MVSSMKKSHIILLLILGLAAWLTFYAWLIMEAERKALKPIIPSNLSLLEDKSFKRDIYSLKKGWPSTNIEVRRN